MTTISYVSSTSVEANNVASMPSHQAGDLLVMGAFNNSSTTIPTTPAGWEMLSSRAGSGKGSAIYYKIAASGAETSGTFTNASFLSCAVYREATNYLSLGAVSSNNGTGTSIGYAGIAMTLRTGAFDAWLIGFGAGALNSTTTETAPTGMTNRTSVAGASAGEVGLHDSNGVLTTWSNQNVAVSSEAWHAWVFEIYDTGIAKAAGGSGGVIGGPNMRAGMMA